MELLEMNLDYNKMDDITFKYGSSVLKGKLIKEITLSEEFVAIAVKAINDDQYKLYVVNKVYIIQIN